MPSKRLSSNPDGDRVRALCRELGFPEELTLRLHEAPFDRGLLSGDFAAAERMHAAGKDPDGLDDLSAMLSAALLTRENYRARGIPDFIFLDTMGCFLRFAEEYRRGYGRYGFAQWWWAWRQLSMRLFRLGTLEYELGEKCVAVHIPLGADLSDPALDDSFSRADAFFSEYFSERFALPPVYECDTWLLAPKLGKFLKRDSKIRNFRRRFRVTRSDEDSEGYKYFLFGRSDLSPEEFPEETSLQRAVKAYILAGGKLGVGGGKLVEKCRLGGKKGEN